MANIPQYNAPQSLDITPSETGEVSAVRAGARIAELGGEASRQINAGFEAVKAMGQRWTQHLEQQDAINLANGVATTMNGLSSKVPEFVHDNRADPALFQRLQDEIVGPANQNLISGAMTPAGVARAKEHAAQMSMHFNDLAVRDASTLRGIDAVATMKDSINQYSQVLMNHPDALPLIQRQFETGLRAAMDGISNLDPVSREKIYEEERVKQRTEFQRTAFGSLLNRNPSAAERALKSGAFPDMPGSWAEDKIHEAQVRNRQLENLSLERQNFERMSKDRQDMADYFRVGGTLGPGGQFVPNPDYLQNMIKTAGTPGGPSETTVRMALSYANKPDDIRSGEGELHKAIMGLADGSMTIQQIHSKIGVAGGLSKSDAAAAISTMADKPEERMLIQQTMNEAKMNLAPPSATNGWLGDPGAMRKLTSFTAWYADQMKAGYQKGLTVTQLLSPNSENYILKDVPWTDPRFQGSLEEQVHGAVSSPAAVLGAAAASHGDEKPGLFNMQDHEKRTTDFIQRVMDIGEHGHLGDVSPKGATGRMQVMPDTASSPGFGIAPADPSKGAADVERVGRQYARKLMEHFSQSETLAAAAYNAGPAKVHEWMNEFGDPRTGAISDAQFASRIPFAETQDYVRRVVGARTAPLSPEEINLIMRGAQHGGTEGHGGHHN